MNKKSYDEKDFTIINGAKGKFNTEYNLKKQFVSSSSLVGHASLPEYKDPYTNAARVDTVIKCGGSIGRGKTYTANKLSHYLNWLGYSSRVFNVANYRQKTVGALGLESHNFFDPANLEAKELREEAAKHALKDIIKWFESDNKNTVAIYDATNITKERRKNVLNLLTPEDIDVIFIEIICNDSEIIKNNISDIRVSSPDYKGMNPDKAEEDFNLRIAHYEKVYEPLDLEEEEKLSFIKSINIRTRVIVNRVDGYIQTRIVYFLMNLHAAPRTIYFTRHGESQFNVQGRIGGDAYLSPRGELFAKKLPSVFAKQIPKNQKVTIWTSTLKRTIQTSQYMPYPKSGESYRDLVQRLEPIIMELERFHDPDHTIVIIGHQAVIRCLYSYFMNYDHEELPYVKIPLHTLIKVTPKAYNCDVEL
ncbi:bifunctional 6-phosphofructo-2-kinase/fructose-2,6-bisphosphate 2-phosphatase [Neocallimastix californiae]|uniref:Bifunctional 6-phosphofructo-2-kinase/fructose-2,6-bisphosphate 2-phosphatase n=1 Tax=Neocallimastix californiae TaxID=1754190 RepID=A0A1Y2AIP3_9FUNG|nr:bifunctional 6-phosphofructo-2-kinase/fructose-2,6-bisphosphate 2-phosphatase [Neocallimastix californiae]|eukprot:ORY22170.1 bifunctional 6-phosphofructo-2-kinase/fructose-2,6-bisphosphate 2-phosphatase [Neocallimastix californiae]